MASPRGCRAPRRDPGRGDCRVRARRRGLGDAPAPAGWQRARPRHAAERGQRRHRSGHHRVGPARLPAWRPGRPDHRCRGWRWTLAADRRDRRLARLPGREPSLPRRRPAVIPADQLAWTGPMTMESHVAGALHAPRHDPATAELSLLVDVGSAWTKAVVVARARGRWRIAAHAAQPTAWGEEELVNALVARLASATDRRVADRLAELLGAAPRIACHTPRRAGRIGLAAVSTELSGASARRAAESAGWMVAEAATADDGRSLDERLSALQAADVDAWLLTGGFDDGRADQALEMAGLVAAARGAS